MKIILCLILVLLFGGVGYGISASYVKRKKFFFEMANFLSYLKTEISFSHTKLEDIIHGYLHRTTSRDLMYLLNNYVLSIKDAGIQKEILFKNISILSEQERESIYLFFKGLGKFDVFNQLEIIDRFIDDSAKFYELASEESGKYCSLYTKLGVIVGAFLALVII